MKYPLTMIAILTALAWAGCSALMGDTDDPVGQECWIEIYEDANFIRENPWTHVQGPTELERIKELAGYDWNDRISSIRVGRDAIVQVYEHEGFRGEVREYGPDRFVDALSDDRMNDRISSLKISCR